jgi:hypothetical protein
LFLAAAELAGSPVATALAAGSEPVTLTRAELRPSRPFVGRLFEVLAGTAVTRVRLLVPAVWLAGEPAPDAFSVADHVNLRLRGALP